MMTLLPSPFSLSFLLQFADQHILLTLILILTDSLNALHLLSGPIPPGDNHGHIRIMKRFHSAHSLVGILYTFQWILSHVGTDGNEVADIAATAAYIRRISM